jgi:hypothetical protein
LNRLQISPVELLDKGWRTQGISELDFPSSPLHNHSPTTIP